MHRDTHGILLISTNSLATQLQPSQLQKNQMLK